MASASSTTMTGPQSSQPDNDFTPEETQHLEACLILLGQCAHPQAQALHSKVDAIAHPSVEKQILKENDQRIVDLCKADPGLTRTQAIEKARSEMTPRERMELHNAVRGIPAA
jgi:hypothetical protein